MLFEKNTLLSHSKVIVYLFFLFICFSKVGVADDNDDVLSAIESAYVNHLYPALSDIFARSGANKAVTKLHFKIGLRHFETIGKFRDNPSLKETKPTGLRMSLGEIYSRDIMLASAILATQQKYALIKDFPKGVERDDAKMMLNEARDLFIYNLDEKFDLDRKSRTPIIPLRYIYSFNRAKYPEADDETFDKFVLPLLAVKFLLTPKWAESDGIEKQN
jgi:hypothetical protein